jgi:CheY-like chemotaxis protein
MNALRIVLAEPDAGARKHLEDLLGQLGHQVAAVRTGRQLVDLALRVETDLVVAATRLPDMGGTEAANLVNCRRGTPVVLVAGLHLAPPPARLRGGNVMAYLARPVRLANLEAAVALAVDCFSRFQQAAGLGEAPESRTFIERARGAVTRWFGLGARARRSPG